MWKWNVVAVRYSDPHVLADLEERVLAVVETPEYSGKDALKVAWADPKIVALFQEYKGTMYGGMYVRAI